MKLGMPILFEYNSLEENFILANKLNLDFVELNLNIPYCMKDMENLDVKSLLRKYNLEATLHFYDEFDAGSYKEVNDGYLKLLKKYIKLSKDYIKLVNFHNNKGQYITVSGVKNYIYEKNYNEYIINVIDTFNNIKKILSSYNIDFVIENVDDCKDIKFLIDNYDYFIKNNYKFNLDIGHDYLNGEVLYEYSKNKNISFKEFHFHDSTNEKCHLELGKGKIDLLKYKNIIKEDSYVVLEVKKSDDLIKSVEIFKVL